uniref:SID1 transmembrane family member 2-like n=1 Tax=Monopterus albus TaxID=43700 RepID=UPI0009B41BEE|nr:SID1 transmembrane family member 2-like [Monopterus albus]
MPALGSGAASCTTAFFFTGATVSSVIRSEAAALSIRLLTCVGVKLSYQRKYPYNHVGRTLYQPPTPVASETQYFFVDVSTLSSQGTNYKLRASRVESFTLQTDKKFNFTASPSQPQLHSGTKWLLD